MVNKLKNEKSGKSYENYRAVKIHTERNHLAFFKMLIVGFVVLVQVAILLVSHLFLLNLFRGLVVLSLVFSIITAIYILSTNKNSQSKAVWVLFVLVFFLFGYFVYILSDDRIFFYSSRKRYKKIFDESEKYRVKQNSNTEMDESILVNSKFLKNVGSFETFSGTYVKYYPTGTVLFDDVLRVLSSAKEYIFIEFYIISDGMLFERIFEILKQKAESGVDVRIIFDDMGCLHSLSYKTKKRMKKAGIKLGRFNPLVSRFSVALNFRDHRKLIIVDGKYAFTGGANLADEYVNEKRLYGYWKDSGIKLEGPAVNEFVLAYLRQWQFVRHTKNDDYSKFLNKAKSNTNKSAVIPFVDGLDYGIRIGKGVVEGIISNAKKRLYIMTPYFIPEDTVNNLLIQKARSGVDVRLILPGIADKKFVYVVSRSNAERLIKAGVKFYTMKNSFVHSKVILSESQALVGSINVDLRSFYQQFESAVLTDDVSLLNDVKKDFDTVTSVSELITEDKTKLNKLGFRLISGILKILSPFM